MSAHKIQKPENHPKERKQHSQHGESLKSSKSTLLAFLLPGLLRLFSTPIQCTFEDHLLYECRKITASVTRTLAPQNFLPDDCNKTVLKTDLQQRACRMKACNTCFENSESFTTSVS